MQNRLLYPNDSLRVCMCLLLYDRTIKTSKSPILAIFARLRMQLLSIIQHLSWIWKSNPLRSDINRPTPWTKAGSTCSWIGSILFIAFRNSMKKYRNWEMLKEGCLSTFTWESLAVTLTVGGLENNGSFRQGMHLPEIDQGLQELETSQFIHSEVSAGHIWFQVLAATSKNPPPSTVLKWIWNLKLEMSMKFGGFQLWFLRIKFWSKHQRIQLWFLPPFKFG